MYSIVNKVSKIYEQFRLSFAKSLIKLQKFSHELVITSNQNL